MREDQISALLGLAADAPVVTRMLDLCRIKRRPEFQRDGDGEILQDQDWLLNASLGIEFGFDDRATYLAEHPDEMAQHPMLLTQVYLYAHHDGVSPYRGTLPFGLSPDDARDEVRRKLFTFESTRRSYIRDTWELPKFRLVAHYDQGGARLGFLLCILRRPPLPADRDDAERLPSAARILAQLGRTLSDSELRLALGPLRIPDSLVAQQGGLVGIYRHRFGLDLRFALYAGSKDLRLAEAAFHAEHHGGAVGWPGDLPYGLTFRDSPQRLLEKIARAPDHHEDHDFHGTAIWRGPEGRLVVDYDSMENLLTRVQVLAPGYGD